MNDIDDLLYELGKCQRRCHFSVCLKMKRRLQKCWMQPNSEVRLVLMALVMWTSAVVLFVSLTQLDASVNLRYNLPFMGLVRVGNCELCYVMDRCLEAFKVEKQWCRVNIESTLRSAGIPPPLPADGGPERLRSPCCRTG
ncbi:hypothetical protein PoB_003396800 [Plakobranchus ocellatus]|uniref:Uncharacterized protein n=1 Tax=Plakobranchus ocellatus TaxID=259542 RepID=A0AAV4AJL1_9GAST|nr:hypothetical protein PoB_003396800 [Plakobranchus ocellatus]